MTKENIERFNDLKMQIMNRSFSRIIFIMFLIVIFTLLISVNVHATNITQAHNKTIGTTQGGNYPAGMKFKLNTDTTNIIGIVINKVATSTGDKCWLYTGNATDGSNMNWTAFSSFVGTQCVINSPLNANGTYVVAVGSDYGTAVTETYGTAGGFPVTDSKLSWSSCALPNLAQNRFDFFYSI